MTFSFKNKRFAIAFYSICLCGAMGQEPLVLDIPDALNKALSKNYKVQVERFQPMISQAQLLEQQGVFDPAFEMELRRSEQGGSSFIPLELGGNTRWAELYRTGITGLLPWGLRYDLGLESRRQQTLPSGDAFESTAGVTITQPLLQGFGTDVTMARIRVARIGQAMSEWELRQQLINTVSETILVYNDLYFAKLNLEVNRRSRDLAARLLQDNQKRLEIGVMSPLDVTEAKAELASRLEAVLVAERQVKDNENYLKRLVTDDLASLLGRPVFLKGNPHLSPYTGGVRGGIANALNARPDYRRALLSVQQQKITLVMTRNAGLPRLDIVGSFNANGIDDGFRSSLNRLSNEQKTDWTLGAVFSVPIPNRSAKGQIEASKLEIAKSLLDLQRLEQDIVVEIDNAAGQIETAQQRVRATRESRRLFQERLDAEDQKLAAGTGTTFLVLEAQRALAEAENAELRAMTDYNKSVVEYDRSLGRTLEANGVEIDAP